MQLRQEKRTVLEREWKRFAFTSLKTAFQKSHELLDKCSEPEHLEFMTGHIKTVGEIAVNLEVLNDLAEDDVNRHLENAIA